MASNYGDHTSIDAVPMTTKSPLAFQKYLKKIHDGFETKDIERLCFLCRDLISNQDLEGISRGLQLFSVFKKRMLISQDDVSFLIELLECISMKVLVKFAKTWPGASVGQRPPKISRYRLLLFDLAINLTTDQLEEMKLMTSGAEIAVCMEEVRNSFQLFVALEKQDVISSGNVAKLKDILLTEELIEKVRKYEQQTATTTTQYHNPHGFPIAEQTTQSQNPFGLQGASCTSYQPGLVNELEKLQISQHKGPDTVPGITTRGQQNSQPTDGMDNQAASLASRTALLASIDTFPNQAGQASRNSQNIDMTPENLALLYFDSPDTDPSFLDIGPWDPKIQKPVEEMPVYPMSRNPRGLCLVINNMNFGDKLKERRGSDVDAGRLLKLFYKLKFHVRCRNNLTACDIYNQLEQLRGTDHRNYDCFVCCILSHGEEGSVYGSDGQTIEIKELTGLFTGVKCPSLAGKPKIFFVQACQGKTKQLGVQPLETDDPNSQSGPTIPNENDFLLGYATPPGYVSFRHPTLGSWYISSLVQAMECYHKKVDMQNLLALVNSHIGKCSDKAGCKQSAPHVSHLTKALFL